jgi:hypothetical protein
MTKKYDDRKSKTGPGQPDDDRRVSRGSNVKIARDTSTGQFVPMKQANRRPSTTVVETVKKPAPSKPPKKK